MKTRGKTVEYTGKLRLTLEGEQICSGGSRTSLLMMITQVLVPNLFSASDRPDLTKFYPQILLRHRDSSVIVVKTTSNYVFHSFRKDVAIC